MPAGRSLMQTPMMGKSTCGTMMITGGMGATGLPGRPMVGPMAMTRLQIPAIRPTWPVG